MQYQGHLADGSSVQKHSAGGLYPFVLYAKETATGIRWGVITPAGIKIAASWSYDNVVLVAERLKRHHDARRVRASVTPEEEEAFRAMKPAAYRYPNGWGVS
jgi:hypothetical protein